MTRIVNIICYEQEISKCCATSTGIKRDNDIANISLLRGKNHRILLQMQNTSEDKVMELQKLV